MIKIKLKNNPIKFQKLLFFLNTISLFFRNFFCKFFKLILIINLIFALIV